MNNSFSSINTIRPNLPSTKNLDLHEFRKTLTLEIHNCNYRGLLKSAEWLADILKSKHSDLCESTTRDFMSSFALNNLEYILAKISFDNNEFLRCSFRLKDSLRKHPIIDFLYFFSRFKAALKSLYESEIDWMNNESQKYNDGLISLKEDLEEFIASHPGHDAYIVYLYGVTVKKLQLKKEAMSALLRALEMNQYLWPAWFELTDLIDNATDVSVPSNWMKKFFEVKFLKLKNNKIECDKAINALIESGFDDVDDLKIDLAIVNEEINNSVYSLEIFNEIHKKDPYRMDYFCTFSNILFVQENHKMLGELTQSCVKNDRYRYETCCVIGNFYSLRNQHEKAVINFHRALKMNPTDSNTWLLTAHSYFELENYKAAVNCYCKAITYNPNSHRARYGLGQLYEMLKIYKFALICYEKAFELMPNDSRIIIALGTVYEELGRIDEAKTCYYRAHAVGDVEHCALIKLGKIFEKMKDMSQAAGIFNLFIEEVQESGFNALQSLSYAYMFLANYHWKSTHNYEKARGYAMKCCEIPDTKVVGEDLLRKISSCSKPESTNKDVEDKFFNVESSMMNKVPSDENLSNNAMNLTIGDDTVETNDHEMME